MPTPGSLRPSAPTHDDEGWRPSQYPLTEYHLNMHRIDDQPQPPVAPSEHGTAVSIGKHLGMFSLNADSASTVCSVKETSNSVRDDQPGLPTTSSNKRPRSDSTLSIPPEWLRSQKRRLLARARLVAAKAGDDTELALQTRFDDGVKEGKACAREQIFQLHQQVKGRNAHLQEKNDTILSNVAEIERLKMNGATARRNLLEKHQAELEKVNTSWQLLTDQLRNRQKLESDQQAEAYKSAIDKQDALHAKEMEKLRGEATATVYEVARLKKDIIGLERQVRTADPTIKILREELETAKTQQRESDRLAPINIAEAEDKLRRRYSQIIADAEKAVRKKAARDVQAAQAMAKFASKSEIDSLKASNSKLIKEKQELADRYDNVVSKNKKYHTAHAQFVSFNRKLVVDKEYLTAEVNKLLADNRALHAQLQARHTGSSSPGALAGS